MLRSNVHILVPLLVLIILAAPSVSFMLPATQDHLDEIYQPLQALKFFKSKGRAYHKYGPMPNFLLAPGYGASLAYWKVTGSLRKPSEDFPYGFSKPFHQMGFLIFQGRLLFLVLGVVSLAYLAHTLRLVTTSKLAIGFAMLFAIATNFPLVWSIPSPRPDSPMISFAALALAVYVRILFLGMTLRRGILLSLWAVFAVSSKELAAPMFVLPYLGLIYMVWREADRQPAGPERATTAMVYSVSVGVLAYALLNVAYAPWTWVQRVKFWLAGPGIDADVWGGGGWKGQLFGSLACLLDNFGPGGVVVASVALLAFAVARPPRWVMLLLPAVSVYLLGLARIEYPADRFFTILALALLPAIAAGLGEVFTLPLRWARRWALGLMLALGAVNLWWATFTWHALGAGFEYLAERDALASASKSDRLYLFNDFPWNPGSTRLELLGFRHDPRPIQRIAKDRTDLPDRIYATQGKLAFLDHARTMPARAEMIRRESGFDVAQWNGLEGLGYALEKSIVPRTPAWFPFDDMPAVQYWKKRRTVLVYTRRDRPAAAAAAEARGAS